VSLYAGYDYIHIKALFGGIKDSGLGYKRVCWKR